LEVSDPNKIVSGPSAMPDIVEEIRKFFHTKYHATVVPELEKTTGKKFDEIPPEQHPGLGLIVGGFSSGAYLSEVWYIIIPLHDAVGSAQQSRGQGNFGANWFSLYEPITRYVKGYDLALMKELSDWFVKARGGTALTAQEQKEIATLLDKHEYLIHSAAMPMQEGIAYTRFLVELVINHHRFVSRDPIVGGKVHIGTVTYTRVRQFVGTPSRKALNEAPQRGGGNSACVYRAGVWA